jgi:histidinol-phosphatase
MRDELDFALEIAHEAGRLAMASFGGELAADLKADGTWATQADRAVESLIRTRIAAAFPDHNILGEEEGHMAAGGGAAVSGAPTWIVDPIDGTNNYMTAIPIWATLIALRHGDDTIMGVCNAPAIGECYDAAIGSGARMNGKPISVSDTSSLDDAFVIHASVRRFEASEWNEVFRTVITRSRRDRGFGDFWGHMLVARGAADIMLEPELSVWDVAALQPIVSEAGGKLTKLSGEQWIESGSVLTTNGSLHDAIVALPHH